jgi:succinate-semialdehyde dehydrogenase/glutarate-semialdehyde dehydrogenase
VYHEELFGPVMPVVDFGDLDEAIAMANDTAYGLAAYVWTNDLRSAMRAAEGLEFGMVGVNEWAPNGTEGPFTGWKQSGLGSESGAEGFEEYVETKLVSLGGMG